MSFAFGAPPLDGPPSENPDGPPKDEKTQLEELAMKLANLRIKYKETKAENEKMKIELKQTKDLLNDVQAPTIFNQLQINYMAPHTPGLILIAGCALTRTLYNNSIQLNSIQSITNLRRRMAHQYNALYNT